jgi:hypothetical protein
MRRPWTVLTLLAACSLAACGYVSFGRRISDDEYRLRGEVKEFYTSVQEAFASGNADKLASLFSPSITHPMSHNEVRKWAEDFFRQNKSARFHIEQLDIESVSFVQAVALLKYRVETPDGKGGFDGMERDNLVKDGRHWYVASWEKVRPEPENRPGFLMRR